MVVVGGWWVVGGWLVVGGWVGGGGGWVGGGWVVGLVGGWWVGGWVVGGWVSPGGKPWAKNHSQGADDFLQQSALLQKIPSTARLIYNRRDEFIADFTIETTITLTGELGNNHTRFMRSSELDRIDGQKTDRLIQILKRVSVTHYISGPSAQDYIEIEKFAAAGITLEYMRYDYPEYPQLYPPYDPFVSVLDLLYMVGPDAGKYFEKGK